MNNVYQLSIVISFAYILDLLFGDPRWMPHPVKIIGYFIAKFEPIFRKIFKNNLKLAGVIFTITIVGGTFGLIFFISKAAFYLNNIFGIFISAFLIYTTFAIKDLKDESMEVFSALEKKDIILARKKLSMIVGRDTENLNENEIVRATVETISENLVDGIISPIFFAFLGGAPLALAFKAVSTLDSMVGYKNEKYINFGWASARLDDLANFISARISIFFISFASLIIGKYSISSIKIAIRDGDKNPSPNSGISEAAFAGALGVQLGGLNYYRSKAVLKPIIGDNIHSLNSIHIIESIKLVYLTSFLFLLAGLIINFLV